MQNFTPISGTVAEISVPGQKKQKALSRFNIWQIAY